MINCAKCGNPLQPGLSSCPICGTATSNAIEQLEETPVVEKLTQEKAVTQVAPAPVPEAAPVSAPVVPTTTPAPAIQQPQPVPPTPQPVASSPTPNTPAPQAQPVQSTPSAPVAPTQIPAQPTATQTPESFTLPQSPASLGTPILETPQTQKKEETKKEPKKKKSSIVPIIVLSVIISLSVGFVAGKLLSKPTATKPKVEEKKEEVASVKEINANGFSFNMDEKWDLTEQYSDTIIINDKDETFTFRMALVMGTFNNINQQNIEDSINSKEGYTELKIQEIELNKKDAFFIEVKKDKKDIEYYYVGQDDTTTIVVTIVYETKESKKTNSSKIRTLLESVKYTDQSSKASAIVKPNNSLFYDSSLIFKDATNPLFNKTTE